MATVFLSLGTNLHREYHLAVAKTALARLFGEVRYSSIYESDAVGFKGDPFFNLVAQVETALSVYALSVQLKRIEDDCGRDRSSPKFSSRTLDIDLLTYDDHQEIVEDIELPRPETVQQAFVLWPMAELVPERLHPGTHHCYQDLWQDFQAQHPQQAAALRPVALSMSELSMPELSMPEHSLSELPTSALSTPTPSTATPPKSDLAAQEQGSAQLKTTPAQNENHYGP